MEKTNERNRRSRSMRRFRFFTDSESQGRAPPNSESSEPREVYASLPRNKEGRSANKLRDIIRRNYKFLTQTQYSNPLYSSYEQESFTPKRSRSPLQQDQNGPQKKLKMNEGNENNQKGKSQDGLDFDNRYHQPQLNNKK